MRWPMRLLLTLLLLGGWSVLIYFYADHTLESPQREKAIVLEIPHGASSTEIGQLLEKNGLIRSDRFFNIYVRVTGATNALQAGVYEIPPDKNLEGILQIMASGKQNTFRVTIPEGFTVKQIADRLSEHGIDQDQFLEAVDNESFDYEFIKELDNNDKRLYRLEGYLFPSTYEIRKGASPEEIIDIMLKEFDKRLQRDGVKNKLKEQNLTVDKWVTIASIVEREGQVNEELPRISGVIHNRLEIGMPLQVDATIQYLRGEQKARLMYKDLEVDSPYNTYKVKGLPPGPISSPGEAALNAVLEPEDHEYLYYVTRKDGTKLHYFSKTYKEHLALKSKSEKSQTQTSGQ